MSTLEAAVIGLILTPVTFAIGIKISEWKARRHG